MEWTPFIFYVFNINQSFANLWINYLNLIKEKKFYKLFKKVFFQEITLMVACERVYADEVPPPPTSLCSVAARKENINIMKHNEFIFVINTTV